MEQQAMFTNSAIKTKVLSDLAYKMNLTNNAAIVLPTAITVASSKVNMTEEEFINKCFENAPLRNYVASVCCQIAATGI